ncbi:cytoplasmic protein [Tumebacillus algifaecis]|uniref:Cytoplasmic protein n=1 Tax=Tumebacillus algifaecis TaxID=1214604 RepID=A0A223CWH7_9BACL|nr:DUF4180 domain-containing protein [Tumebacillus algifaecis]ASS73676.1 cytoplasmic protein [Tumebacillus algifaecis]
MKILIDQVGDSKVAIVESADILIGNAQDALDLMATVKYTDDCYKILIPKSNITESFFELSTRLAGEILQKYTNYQVRLAIVGDFDEYDSKSLHAFIIECNRGKQVFFLPDVQTALDKLHSVA